MYLSKGRCFSTQTFSKKWFAMWPPKTIDAACQKPSIIKSIFLELFWLNALNKSTEKRLKAKHVKEMLWKYSVPPQCCQDPTVFLLSKVMWHKGCDPASGAGQAPP